jgi:hypothetical protein
MTYTTPYRDSWKVKMEKILPLPMNYFAVLSFITLILGLFRKDDRVMFLGYSIIISLIFFFIAEYINLINIRFIPFVQLLIMVMPACLLDQNLFSKIKPLKRFISSLKHWTIPLIIFVLVIYFVETNVTYIKHWVKWNYEGFENKPSWEEYKSVNDFISGDYSDPRVMYEHSDKHNTYGTPRAFELLPYFSGRSTLEGLFMQSSISSPFVFHIQSEVGEQHSCPFWNLYPCTTFNLTTGTKHLEMFNVEHFIVRSERVKTEIRNFPDYKFLKEIGDIQIYELESNKDQYVIVPDYKPFTYPKKNWKTLFYEWFKNYELLDTPIIKSKNKIADYQMIENLEEIQKVPINNEACLVDEKILQEELRFTTTCPGKPHIIRISYHPNWKVQGAEKIYLVSPSFMLVFPEGEEVKMWYGWSLVDIISYILTFIGILFLVSYAFLNKHKVIRFLKR